MRAFFVDADPGVVAVYVFGSVARGTAGPDSDVDVAVLFAVDPPRTLMGRPFALADDLRFALGRAVDLVVLNDAPGVAAAAARPPHARSRQRGVRRPRRHDSDDQGEWNPCAVLVHTRRIMVNASSGPLPNPPPSSTATALTRPDELSTKRTLGDLSEEELRMLAAIVVHERPTLATRALAARGPLAIAATSFVGAGALFWNAVASTGPARIWIGTLGLAALSVGLTMLALVSRTPRFSAFAPAVAFLEERGVASRHLNGILRRLSAVVSGTSRSGDVEAVYRCLAPWGARDAEHPGQEPRADLLPAALLTGIARDWLATRPPLATIFAVAANPLLQLLRGQEGLLDLDRALLVCLGVIPVAFLSIKRLLPMRKAFLASLELGLADGEEQRLVDVFNAALKETRRERRKLSHEDAAALIVQKVLALLDDKVPVDSALDDERRRLLHDRGAEPAPQAVDDVVVADEAVATKGR